MMLPSAYLVCCSLGAGSASSLTATTKFWRERVMAKETATGFRAYGVTLASTIALCIVLVTACAQGPSQTPSSPASQVQNTAPSAPAKTKLETDTDVRTLKGHTEWVISV